MAQFGFKKLEDKYAGHGVQNPAGLSAWLSMHNGGQRPQPPTQGMAPPQPMQAMAASPALQAPHAFPAPRLPMPQMGQAPSPQMGMQRPAPSAIPHAQFARLFAKK